jgi:hypothetical protein
MIPGRRLRSIGWLALIGVCFALYMVLSFRVGALKSEVRLAENRIVALKRDKLYLETEFETRASQQQLKAWNDVEFGYVAPASGQYVENERQLAMLGKPMGPDAPAPIRVASADDAVVAAAAFPAMVSPLTGKPLGEEDKDAADAKPVDHAAATAALGKRLGTVERDDEDDRPATPARKDKAKKPASESATTTRDRSAATTATAARDTAKAKPKPKTNPAAKAPAKTTREARR